jgi:transcriptional regulator with XRE-family HTH domain
MMRDTSSAVIKITTGSELKEWRIAAGLSQKALSQALECTRQTIARLEADGDGCIPREWMYAFTFLKLFPEEFGVGDEQKMQIAKPRRR